MMPGKLFNLWRLSFSICNTKGNGLWVLTSQGLPEDAPTSLTCSACTYSKSPLETLYETLEGTLP